jgi:hypothetical protein
MKKISILIFSILFSSAILNASSNLQNDYTYLQEITFEMYTDDIPAYNIPEEIKSIEEVLMFEVLHATWKDKHWVGYTLNKNLLGTFRVGQPALIDNGSSKKIFFVAAFPGTIGGLDLYSAEQVNGTWTKPKNLGPLVNTSKNESNPGLLDDNTLTYSSGGVIKKLDLKTLKVIDLEESITPKVTAETNIKKPEVIVPSKTVTEVKETTKPEVKTNTVVAPVINTTTTQNSSVQSLGAKTRDEMLSKYANSIQLGVFSSPNWPLIQPLSKFGKLLTYKNEKGANVVWLTGFANKAEAESALAQVKATKGFENSYIAVK